MNELIVHKINVAHYRLIELTKLAEQAKPFYDWIEKKAKATTNSHHSLSHIIITCTKKQLKAIIVACYQDATPEKPFLFDGIGRVYKHPNACFFFFAWLIRDAPQQRLSPLISRMTKADNVKRFVAETDTLVALIHEYRSIVFILNGQLFERSSLIDLRGRDVALVGIVLRAISAPAC